MVCPACCGRGSGGKQVDKKLQKVVPPVNADASILLVLEKPVISLTSTSRSTASLSMGSSGSP